MVKTSLVKNVNYIMLALLVLANIYGGVFSVLSGLFVGVLMLIMVLAIAVMGIALYAVDTGTVNVKKITLPVDENQKIVNRVVAGAIYLLVFTLHWYTAGMFLVVSHAILFSLYYFNKEKFLAFAEAAKEKPGE